MTPSSANESDRNRLEKIAADYRAQGHDVKVKPRADDLPAFLAEFEPDLIAAGQGGTIVVEVKTGASLRLHRLLPDWKLSLEIGQAGVLS